MALRGADVGIFNNCFRPATVLPVLLHFVQTCHFSLCSRDPFTSFTLLDLLTIRMSKEKLKTAPEAYKLLMDAAIHSVKEGGKSERDAAKQFGVNRQTLRNRRQNLHTKQVGRQRKFPPEELKGLADFLLSCSDMGIPLNRHHCRRLISQLAEQLGTVRVLE